MSAYSTIELTARQTARFKKMLRTPVSYCQPEGKTTSLKRFLNFKILGEDGLVKCAPDLHLVDLCLCVPRMSLRFLLIVQCHPEAGQQHHHVKRGEHRRHLLLVVLCRVFRAPR